MADITHDTLSTSTGTAISANVLTGTNGATADTFEGSPTVTAVTQAAHGTVTFSAAGLVTYTPAANYTGPDSFTYTVTSGGVTETATVNITVTAPVVPVNHPPVADNDSFSTSKGVTSGAIDLLTGDTDVDGDTLSVVSIAGTTLTPGTAQTIAVPHGTVNVSATGAITFTPEANYSGPVSFEYVVADGKGGRSTGNVSGTVNNDTGTGAGTGTNAGTTDTSGSVAPVRDLTVSNPTISEASPYAVFTVTGAPGQLVRLALASGTATLGVDTGTSLQYFNGTAWVNYTPGTLVPIPAGGSTLLVRVNIIGDTGFEGAETFKLNAINTNGSVAQGTGTLRDDGVGDIYPDNISGANDPNAPRDDDRPRTSPVPMPIAAPAVSFSPLLRFPTDTFNARLEIPSFSSALKIDPWSTRDIFEFPLGEILTHSSGFQIAVIEAEAAKLSVFHSITDQFVEMDRPSRFALPYDAFVHTRPEATITLEAKLANGSDLPKWIQFDSRSGTFQLNPPHGFRGEFQIKITARDKQGGEAVSMFRLFVGEPEAKNSGRNSMDEQIQQAAKRLSPWNERTHHTKSHAPRHAITAPRMKV